jgi:hypothetical protein
LRADLTATRSQLDDRVNEPNRAGCRENNCSLTDFTYSVVVRLID